MVLMMEQHLGVWLWRWPGRGESLADYPTLVLLNALGGAAAPLFVTLAGYGSMLLAQRRQAPDVTLLRRGVVILGFAYALSLATPSWFTWRSWFVLHLIGASTLLAPVLRRLPNYGLLAAGAAVLWVSVIAQTLLETPFPLSNMRMGGWVRGGHGIAPTLLDGGLWRLMTFEGHFPLFPWLAFYMLGMVSARLSSAGLPKRQITLGITLLAAGGTLAALGPAGLGLLGQHSHLFSRAANVHAPFYPATPAFVLLLGGGALLAIGGAEHWEKRRGLSAEAPLVVLGRVSLTLLLLHVVVGRELSRPLGLWRNCSAETTLIVIAASVVGASLLARRWGRAKHRYGAEWLLRKLAP